MEFVFEDKSSQGSLGQDFAGSLNNSIDQSNTMQMSANNNIFGAPTISQTTTRSPSRRSRRSLPETVDEIELTGRRKRATKKASSSKVKYVKAPTKRRTSGAKFVWTWQKFWWMVAFVTFMRLLFMENGVVDYYNLENTIESNKDKLALIQKENKELVSEIHKIQTSPKYQRKVARDHLGVIASNEYLVLFSGD